MFLLLPWEFKFTVRGQLVNSKFGFKLGSHHQPLKTDKLQPS